MDSRGSVSEAIKADYLKWFLISTKLVSAIFFAFSWVALRQDLNVAGCRYAIKAVVKGTSGGMIQ